MLLILLLYAAVVAGAATNLPTVKLNGATVIGTSDGSVTQFLGIPFAEPPVGKLRLQLPQPIRRYSGVVNATTFGNQCLQQTMPPAVFPNTTVLPPEIAPFVAAMGVPPPVPQSEDCLNLNVIVPAGTKPGDKLPVAVWIFGGKKHSYIGSNAVRPGQVVVKRSLEIGHPVIYVSMNYRLSALGFLGGREIANAGLGNLGLQDQRESLRWIQKHIGAFGGDPTKVTIWGESAGSESVAFHMLVNGGNTEGLFRAGWMESGSVNPAGNVSNVQPHFDFIASETGCADEIDILECLREVPTSVIQAAVDKTSTYVSFQGTPWAPRADGLFLVDNPQRLLLEGKIADIPFVIGSNKDEGTLFSLASLNLTTQDEVATYLSSNFFPNAPKENITRLLDLYPANPAFGAPFDTGDAFAFSPQYKRISAFQGDSRFGAPRRLLLQQRSGKQVMRSFLSERNQITGMGATHTTELANVFGGGDMTDFLVRFVDTLDPNGGEGVHWPAYTAESPQLLVFANGKESLAVIPDTFRKEANEFLIQLGLEQPN
ncbi:carotenoid ester lipase precursor [Trametes versicolor FP-101664 SS1]|uniref:carotenoid ester lipase precursor n=1 Tax=Trametes versicolor (strain FP-101664) TaxID=717944 RepID=UPI0004621982|nr:carotenoid ester lipase precursor [Trametes versicolor FP-101664 SS1]EIW58851.1 carotenoid ester lipase precursor [Trametes versicolor FP-101664 SS1]